MSLPFNSNVIVNWILVAPHEQTMPAYFRIKHKTQKASVLVPKDGNMMEYGEMDLEAYVRYKSEFSDDNYNAINWILGNEE